jgi:hypothetical protein
MGHGSYPKQIVGVPTGPMDYEEINEFTPIQINGGFSFSTYYLVTRRYGYLLVPTK